MNQKKSNKTNRKEFLKKTALGLASISIVPRFVLGGKGYTAPSDKITIGFIGNGKQGTILANPFIGLNDTQIIACSDVDSVKQTKFMEWANRKYAEASNHSTYYGCRAYADYEDILERDDIDAVIVCTPDHWHAIPVIKALNAGKDVYCEKPLSLTVEEGRAMVNAAKRNNRVTQTGSMQRSWGNFRKACELVRNGYLGEITEIKVNVGGPPVSYDLPRQPLRASLDWNRWIGPSYFVEYNETLAPPYPWDNYPMWRSYKEFGGGGVTDWGAHMFDIIQWALGMDNSGPVEFIPPTQKGAQRGLVFKYENGITVIHEDFGRGNAVRFIGTDGSLDISRGFFEPSDMSLVEHDLSGSETKLYRSDNHYKDWIDAIKSRGSTVSDFEVGHRTASVCNIANIAYDIRRPLTWNPETERFVNDQYANSMLSREYRDGYSL
ncbi:MAG: Gfo/Idh/MocA family oxidoreductase [Balneolaceae bacterium]|nr:Gfo/Idh/MocA family oxidoreductase [Balneolaceae bacterium]MBO6546445.1 Gfo/Idh/MocA family oxidoreductase [Balneolaceae bacterium]MBO6648804.1 Gfo/Idh/MocA family oxidoreductase [Balneolaceae bacterium]